MTNSKTPKLVAGLGFWEIQVFNSKFGWNLIDWTSVQGFIFHGSFFPVQDFLYIVAASLARWGWTKPQPQTKFHKSESRIKAMFTRWFNVCPFHFSLRRLTFEGPLNHPKRAHRIAGNFQIYSFFETVLYSSTLVLQGCYSESRPHVSDKKSPGTLGICFSGALRKQKREGMEEYKYTKRLCRNTTMTWLSKL